jgi:uncharacterized membrane protein YfcA
VDPAIALSGLLVGALVGLTGVGGGSLLTPLLILFFDVKPVTAVGTDLLYGAITKTAGGYKHYTQHTVDVPLAWWMAIGSVPAAILGVVTLELLEGSLGADFDDILLAAVAGAVLFAGLAVLARAVFAGKLAKGERDSVPLTRRHKVAAIVVGAFVGFVLGVTSVGSGALIGVALILAFRLTPRRIVGTDVFHAAILLWAAAAAHLVSQNVDLALAANLLIGSIPGIWIGSHASVRLPVAALRAALATVLVASGVALSAKAGWAPSLLSFAVCALPGVALATVLTRRQSRSPATTVRDPVSEQA